jgi:hypothetical protein
MELGGPPIENNNNKRTTFRQTEPFFTRRLTTKILCTEYLQQASYLGNYLSPSSCNGHAINRNNRQLCSLFQFPLGIKHKVKVLQQRSDCHLGLLHGKILSNAITCSHTEREVSALGVLLVPSIQLELVWLTPVFCVHMQRSVVK